MAYATTNVSVSGSFDNGIRKYTRTYLVTTDQTSCGPGQIATFAPGYWGDYWVHGSEVDVWARLKTKTATCMGDGTGGFLWTVVCEYDSSPAGKSEGGADPSTASEPAVTAQQSPPDRPWTIEVGSTKTSKILTTDINDDPILYKKADGTIVNASTKSITNSSGQPFDPPVEMPAFHGTLTIGLFKSISSDNFVNVKTYTNRINSTTFLGFTAGSLLVTEYKLTSQYEQGSYFWHKHVTLEIHPETWNPVQVLDAGTMWKESGSKPLQAILDKSGNPVTSPVPLDGLGKPLNANGDLVYMTCNGYKKISFAGLI